MSKSEFNAYGIDPIPGFIYIKHAFKLSKSKDNDSYQISY